MSGWGMNSYVGSMDGLAGQTVQEEKHYDASLTDTLMPGMDDTTVLK
jgi:hypothetical protein